MYKCILEPTSKRQGDQPSVLDLACIQTALEVETIQYEPLLGKNGQVMVRLDHVVEETTVRICRTREV